MSVVQTVLVFAGIPIGVLLVVAVAVIAPSAVQGGRTRYRPGRPWNYDTAWWLPQGGAPTTSARRDAIAAERASALGAVAAAAAEQADRSGKSAAEAAAIGEQAAARQATAAVGGASGEW